MLKNILNFYVKIGRREKFDLIIRHFYVKKSIF